ncbi:MAG: tetratricopeptide repeat protein [Treponema sp.]|nr:tetratricopeptide repeat protein [Treponema sp.]
MIKNKKLIKYISAVLITAFVITSTGCSKKKSEKQKEQYALEQYKLSLETQILKPAQRLAIIKLIANDYLLNEDYQGLILFLTNIIEKTPDDIYNAYYMLETAFAYLKLNAEPIAEYYFDRILQKCPDIIIKGTSAHFICLQNLIQISKTPSHRIKYFNELINRFPNDINKTELYLRLAHEYEKDNQWEEALKTCSLFLQQPDATTIQIPGEPDAYKNARRLVDFNKSTKDWTFSSLKKLETAIISAINNSDGEALDRYKAKVNFFTMSWKQDETDDDSTPEDFSMVNWIDGNTIQCSKSLDESSNPNEAYLKTWGWNSYVDVWYFYFKKVNFPLDPEINGDWEWAGIYIGNKL